MLGHRSLRLILPALVLLAPLVAGCGNKVIGIPPEPPPPTAPIASSDVAAIQRLVWAWNQRDTTALEDLFTADFVFAASGRDTTVPRGETWYREDELQSSRHLFVDGTTTQPPATSITLMADPVLRSEPDSRIGKDSKWHREVFTSLVAGIRTVTGFYTIAGYGRFFVVRGDSAKIPQALKDRGYLPDSTRWWIERWEDETDGVGRNTSLASVKTLYLPLPPASARARF